MELRETLLLLPGILMGFAFHEYAHAQMAVWLGDDTPRHQGRLSLSPLVHIDIIGFIMILVAGFGWAKPVEIDPRNFKNPKRDDILVSLAGPLTNLFIAIVFAIMIKVFTGLNLNGISDELFNTIIDVFDYTVWINIVLFVFNLLPVPPLDGSHIFFGLLGLKEKPIYYEIYSKGRFILLLLIITSALDQIISPPILGVYSGLYQIMF